ncbi:hypothetical protein LXA54_17045 [Erwinia amylovora]|uniref:hypothetical protein n=1 Tax=Erwinia amylovora TaxID=552 RepID=UPI0020BFC311|nr:hypothetical protein [Erwinia amylovora]MCK8335997.1 hypothetical protein [Erwinia amylovora]
MKDIANLNLNYFAIFTVLGLLCCTFLIFITALHVLECNKGRKESGYENMMGFSGLAAFIMLIFTMIAWAV